MLKVVESYVEKLVSNGRLMFCEVVGRTAAAGKQQQECSFLMDGTRPMLTKSRNCTK